MDTFESLRAKIPDFSGYLNEGDRRRSDELVRSYVGEALAALQSRVAPAGEDLRFEHVLLRAGFMNQIAFRAFEYATLDGERVRAISANDVRILDLADRAVSIEPGGVDVFLSEVTAAFDLRDRAMESPVA